MGARDDNDLKQTLSMTSASIGRDLLDALVLEVRMLPDVWPKLPQAKQQDVIERLRARVESAVVMATHLIAANARTAVPAMLESFANTKSGLQAKLVLSKTCPARHELLDSQGQEVLIIVASADEHMGDLDAVKGEPDQRAMDLGHEYDPDGDGKGMEGAFQPGSDDEVVDVIAIEHQPLQAELDQAYRDGYWAFTQSVPKDACPAADHRIVAQWTQGWTDAASGTKPRVDPFVRKDSGDDATGDAPAADAAPAAEPESPVQEAPAAAPKAPRSSASKAKPAAKAPAKKAAPRKGGSKR